MVDMPLINPNEEASEEEFAAALKAAQTASSVAAEPDRGSSRVNSLDSLQANEFAVELNDTVVTGVFRVEGLTSFKLDTSTNSLGTSPILLAKMVQRDATLPFSLWIKDTVAAGKGAERPMRTLAIVAIDDGEETRRWTLRGAWISEIRYSEFDTSSGDLVEEIVTIHYNSIEEQWSWQG